MAKRICVVLGDQEYQVPRLNMGELEALTELMSDPAITDQQRPYRILALALARAEPPVRTLEEFKAVEADLDQLADGVRAIFGHAGMAVESPPVMAAPALVKPEAA